MTARVDELSTAEAIEVINSSAECFVCGLLSFVPGLGIFPAACAMTMAMRIRTRCRGKWNPASQFVRSAIRLACFGIFLTAALSGVFFALSKVDPSRIYLYPPQF